MPEYRFTGANIAQDGTMLPFTAEFEAPTDEEALSVVHMQLAEWRKQTYSGRPHTRGAKLVRIDVREQTTSIDL